MMKIEVIVGNIVAQPDVEAVVTPIYDLVLVWPAQFTLPLVLH